MSADTNDPVRVALIGYGLGGKVFYAPLIASVPSLSLVTLVTLVTRDPTRQAEARESYPSARVLDRPGGGRLELDGNGERLRGTLGRV